MAPIRQDIAYEQLEEGGGSGPGHKVPAGKGPGMAAGDGSAGNDRHAVAGDGTVQRDRSSAAAPHEGSARKGMRDFFMGQNLGGTGGPSSTSHGQDVEAPGHEIDPDSGMDYIKIDFEGHAGARESIEARNNELVAQGLEPDPVPAWMAAENAILAGLYEDGSVEEGTEDYLARAAEQVGGAQMFHVDEFNAEFGTEIEIPGRVDVDKPTLELEREPEPDPEPEPAPHYDHVDMHGAMEMAAGERQHRGGTERFEREDGVPSLAAAVLNSTAGFTLEQKEWLEEDDKANQPDIPHDAYHEARVDDMEMDI